MGLIDSYVDMKKQADEKRQKAMSSHKKAKSRGKG